MRFPVQTKGVLYLAEGGQETEIMYKFGHDLPEFAMFTLLDKPSAMAEVRGMFQRYLDVAQPYRSELPGVLFAGIIGPRGDAYELNRTITAEEAEDYHGVQMANLREAEVDIVSAMTFNNVPEAVGVSRAAAAAGLPLSLSFTLTSSSRLKSGPSLREAIETVDARAGEARPDFYGVNCSHPLEFEPALEPGDWILRVRSLRPNAAKMDKISLCKLGHLEQGDPKELGMQMGNLARRYPHLDVWGGCCGTWETHLDDVARQVQLAHRM